MRARTTRASYSDHGLATGADRNVLAASSEDATHQMILFLSATDGSPISISAAAVSRAVADHLSSVQQLHCDADSLYSIEWRGKSGRQVVETRVHRDLKAIEVEGELQTIAPLALAIRRLVSSLAELMLFDEGYSANLVLTDATSPELVVETWRAI